MAKIIVISNGKGGTGKSTLCMQFANYLTSIGKSVAVLDADEGQTIVDLREVEVKQRPDTPLPWKVWNAAENAQAFVDRAKQMGDDTYVLVDCPGSLNSNLLPFFRAANTIVIPFRYVCEDSEDGTYRGKAALFAELYRHPCQEPERGSH